MTRGSFSHGLRRAILGAFLSLLSATALSGTARGNQMDSGESLVLRNGQTDLRSRANRLGTSAGSPDTLWVGYTPSAVVPGNWWGVHAGFGKDGFNRPGQPTNGLWRWDTPVRGDSLQGWWPLINVYGRTGNQTRADRNRPWWALDYGNMASYRINQANGRTYGVVGVWHRDGGSLAPAPAGLPSPEWAPAQGNHAAWMGLRAHGDNAYSDGKTGNPFNEDVLMYTGFNSVSAGGNDQGFPGYGSQMDQMLYRDIDFAGNTTASLTLRFRFRTVMSTGFGTAPATRTGWYDSDPLGVVNGPSNPQRNNFISSTDAGDALAPRDSFMVYIGQGIENQLWLPAASNFSQNLPARPVYDKRRWFGEVLRWDRDPGSPPANPRPLYYRELLSVTGVWPAHADTSNSGYVDTTYVISNAVLAPLLVNGRLRVVFRVKTNAGFDDQTAAYSSNQRGAAVVDRVSYRLGAGPEVVFGDFESAGDIDNDIGVSATAAWKSTGKPPGIFHHTHEFADLLYEDLCGQKGDIGRQCNMNGVVISTGDHDNAEASRGFVDGTAQTEVGDGIMSPAIQLRGPYDQPGGKNRHGFTALGSGAGDADATEDMYIFYDVYTGIFDPFTKGCVWRVGVMCYPGESKDPDGPGGLPPYPAWGQMRFPSAISFNADPQCLIAFDALERQGLIRTSNSNGIPDSIRIFLGKFTLCFQLGLECFSSTDGGYWDNVSLALVDGDPAPVTVDLWNWINDAFPANEASGLPGTAAFDTAAAYVKTGHNIAQVPSPASNLRFDVPGDSVVIRGGTTTARVDMVFRILPGPGNYEPVGRPDLGTIVRRPDSRAVVTPGDGSYWDSYRTAPGAFASPSASALHGAALGGWDPNVWNSARCDTAELNLFARQQAGAGHVLGGPPDPTVWMSAYHEADPKHSALGIVHNRCFLRTAASALTDIQCDGAVPTYISNRPEHADVTGTTREGTKIIPDGLLAPGAHVEYFFRSQTTEPPGAPGGFCPDTSIVMQTITEGSTDGHRWQEFGVLPNAWKRNSYFHPVVRAFGAGPACMLVVDANDRRGNERVWVGVSDTVGLTPQRYWGAHNGWHAVGNGDIDDPADNRRGSDNQPGFVPEHIGQAGSGSAWDMYQVKGAESLTHRAGSIGSRKANRTGGAVQQLVIDKSSRQGPTPGMLDAYYPLMLFLSGDLNLGVLGAYSNHSQNDVGLIMDWLNAASTSSLDRGFWAIGDGFAESNIDAGKQVVFEFMYNYLGADLYHWNYMQFSGNTDVLAQYRLLPGWQNKGAEQIQLFGMRNLCLWTNDVLIPSGVGLPSLATVSGEYDRKSAPGGPFLAPAGVFKKWSAGSPYQTLVEGWDIEHLTHPADLHTRDRSGYFSKILVNVWSALCSFGGIPILDTPVSDGGVSDFVRLLNNPVARGHATIELGLARPDRVEVKIFDVSGRLVRTLADRQLPAGKHRLVWDGLSDAGAHAARGVYFTQVRYRTGGFVSHRKLTVLR